MRWSFVTAFILLLPSLSVGQERREQPLQELFLTEVVYPQEKHEVQLTLSSLVDRSRSDLASVVPFAIEYGLTDRWQIQASWDGYTEFHNSPVRRMRTARFSIGGKYSLMNIAHSRVHAAVGMDAEFPRPASFAGDEGEDEMELEPFVALAADVGGGVTLFGSAAASVEPRKVTEIVEGGARLDDRGTIGMGGLAAFRRATVVMEFTNRSDVLPWRLDGAALLTPSIAHPGRQWELAAGVPIAVSHGQHQPGLAMHIIKEF